MSVSRAFELALTGSARLVWPLLQAAIASAGESRIPPWWAPAPLLKSRERSKPSLGFPRTTDSLCPACVRDIRSQILSGERSIESMLNESVGEISARILERDG